MQTVNIFPKTLRFSQLHLTKRMTFMSKFTKLFFCFFQSKYKYPRYLCASVLWVAFSIPSGSFISCDFTLYIILLMFTISGKASSLLSNPH
jgi:hypothetical protein